MSYIRQLYFEHPLCARNILDIENTVMEKTKFLPLEKNKTTEKKKNSKSNTYMHTAHIHRIVVGSGK